MIHLANTTFLKEQLMVLVKMMIDLTVLGNMD